MYAHLLAPVLLLWCAANFADEEVFYGDGDDCGGDRGRGDGYRRDSSSSGVRSRRHHRNSVQLRINCYRDEIINQTVRVVATP